MSAYNIIELTTLVVFIVLKLTSFIAWSWWWVLSPLWIFFSIWMFAVFMVKVLGPSEFNK